MCMDTRQDELEKEPHQRIALSASRMCYLLTWPSLSARWYESASGTPPVSSICQQAWRPQDTPILDRNFGSRAAIVIGLSIPWFEPSQPTNYS